MTWPLLPPGTTEAFAETFVAVSALLGHHDAVRAAEADVPLARAIGRAAGRNERGTLIAGGIERVRRELSEARIS